MKTPVPSPDYDSPWKDILEIYFREFMEFFFPAAAAEIDWAVKPEFLDKELQQITRDARFGRRYVDKLVKVYRKGGGESWVLIHIEVQGKRDPDFPRRMYIYNHRIFERYGVHVVSLGRYSPTILPNGVLIGSSTLYGVAL